MRGLIRYVNSLLLGVILGMILVAIMHKSSSHERQEVRATWIMLGYELLGAKDQRTVLPIRGTVMRGVGCVRESCRCHVDPVFRASLSTIVISISLVKPAGGGHPCVIRK
jgi:hypothetical protein